VTQLFLIFLLVGSLHVEFQPSRLPRTAITLLTPIKGQGWGAGRGPVTKNCLHISFSWVEMSLSNFSHLGYLEMLLLLLTLLMWGGGGGDRVTLMFSHIYFSLVEIRLHFEFQPSRLPRTAITLFNPI
jgi:hypothetical protein